MLYYLGDLLNWGPARLLQSYSVLIVTALYVGFFLVWKFLPKFYKFLPSDRGREFTLTAEAAKGKPTGSGVVFISMFVILCFLIVPLNLQQYCILFLTWVMMLTGFLDDRSTKSWGEYLKAFLDLVVTVAAATVLALATHHAEADGHLGRLLLHVLGGLRLTLRQQVAIDRRTLLQFLIAADEFGQLLKRHVLGVEAVESLE